MKKPIILSLAMAMILGLSACGGSTGSSQATTQASASAISGSTTSSSGSTTTTESAPSDSEMSKNIKIDWVPYHPDAANDGELVKLMSEKFNVTLNMWPRDGLDVRLAAGEIPDVFCTGWSNLRKFANDGVITDVPLDTVKQYAPNLYNEYSANQEAPFDMNLGQIDGKNYGLLIFDGETGGFRKLIVYRGDWIKNVGGKVPTTLAEFEDLMYKFAKNDPDKNGKNDTYGLSANMIQAVYGAFGYLPGSWSLKDGQYVFGAIQPEMKQALTILAKWYKDGVLHPEYVTGENTGGEWSVSNHFVNGSIGVTSGDYLYWKPAFKEGQREGSNIVELKAVNSNVVNELTYGNPPTGPNGQSGVDASLPLHNTMIVFGNQLQKDQEKLQRILAMLDYSIGTRDGFIFTRFGVEGTNYNMGADGYPVAQGQFSDWNTIGNIGGGAVFNMGSWLPSIMKTLNAEYAWASTMPELRQNRIYNMMLIPPKSNDTYSAELDKIRGEAYQDIIAGRQPIDSFDTFVEKWKSSGGDVLTQEMNATK